MHFQLSIFAVRRYAANSSRRVSKVVESADDAVKEIGDGAKLLVGG